ncbi:3-hydroxybutyryl-CoA dehydrogenase [Granulicella rosea]|uniref:3-hydroxybutyryl-CoA dehydrogenase n=1 Tax=Granulicella rosea TaxID=474952 RepID=A0A239HFD9_9BACT|nr:3-hydroxyacyl-CoA dehydrogenase NAD-binding domain-containing protein [Granulicella rosea]SNS79861.1 3-hydroxybutyryl-CoA dehydrogenase [Granulicella rosea]
MTQLSGTPAPHGITVAVIGAGVLGRSFALACATAGFRVILEDVMPSKLRRAESDFASLGQSVELASTVEAAVREADIVVDFVPDELESKLEILSLVDRMAPPKTVMCTPSETLSITDLSSCTYRPDRCVMIRGVLNAAPGQGVNLLYAREIATPTMDLATALLVALGYAVEAEFDPDLPMLMKNQGYAVS